VSWKVPDVLASIVLRYHVSLTGGSEPQRLSIEHPQHTASFGDLVPVSSNTRQLDCVEVGQSSFRLLSGSVQDP